MVARDVSKPPAGWNEPPRPISRILFLGHSQTRSWERTSEVSRYNSPVRPLIIEERGMAEPAYFQWQNDVLLKTIYPLREMKLRDFLIYYKEIDLWAQYGKMDVSALQAEYVAAQER